MSPRLADLRAKALSLDPKERAALAHDLIESLDSLRKPNSTSCGSSRPNSDGRRSGPGR